MGGEQGPVLSSPFLPPGDTQAAGAWLMLLSWDIAVTEGPEGPRPQGLGDQTVSTLCLVAHFS